MAPPLLDAYRPAPWWQLARQAYLLRLLVAKELRVRYQGSALGMVWSYIKPAVQFGVFYFAIGVFLGMREVVDNFAVYLFSGIVIINYVSEACGNATRSVVANAPLVKKVYFPRQLFPLAAVAVAAIHFLPQVVVLLIGALLTGWQPTLTALGAAVIAFGIVSLFSLGIGLLAGGLNVAYRDTENVVDLGLMVLPWLSPVMYTSAQVSSVVDSQWLWWLYHANPVTAAIELFHFAWWSTTHAGPQVSVLGTDLLLIAVIGAGVSLVVWAIGSKSFSIRDGDFAQVL